jgi:hypothetical protein
MICTFNLIFKGSEIKRYEKGWTCSTNGGNGIWYKILVANLKVRGHLGYVGTGGWILNVIELI